MSTKPRMESEAGRIAAIVLAAGMSTRMGRPKMLLPFGGRPLLARVLEALDAAPSVAETVVVTGHEAGAVRAIAGAFPRVFTVHNPGYAQGGMVSSVRAGVAALAHHAEAFFVALGDQPGTHAATYEALAAAWRADAAPIVRPVYQGRRGHPVLFSSVVAPDILALPPDGTLKDIVARHNARARDVAVEDAAIISDVDTPADYARALRRWEFAALPAPPGEQPDAG